MKNNNKTGLYKIIWLMTLVPLLIAWLMAYSGIGLPQATKNNGILMPAGIVVPESLSNIQQGKWGLLVISEQCNDLCQQQVYRMQQVYKSMEKHADRLQPIWLAKASSSDDISSSVDINFNLVNKVNNKEAFRWFNQQIYSWQDQSIWLIDPNGILVMQFQPELSGREIIADIKWLLKASRIG